MADFWRGKIRHFGKIAGTGGHVGAPASAEGAGSEVLGDSLAHEARHASERTRYILSSLGASMQHLRLPGAAAAADALGQR